MAGAYGAPQFSGLLDKCVLWAPLQHSAGVSGDIDEFPIIPSGVTATNTGTFTKTSLGNNRSVLNFDGSTNYINLTYSDAAWQFGSGNFTICGWLNASALTTLRMLLVLGYGNGYGLMIVIDTSQKLGFYASSSNTAWDIASIVGTTTLTTATWYFISITRSGSAFTLRLNLNSEGTATSSGTIVSPDATGKVTIGQRGSDNTYKFSGSFKDLMIYKGRALTQPEIKLLMNRTNPTTGAGLMPSNGEYYRLS